jgi:alanyl-tRNA synthetase
LALEEQKNRARKSRNVEQSMNVQNPDFLAFTDVSSFVGYDTLQHESDVIALFKDGNRTDSASGNFIVVVKETPFYAESGGQAGDQGMMYLNGEELTVLNTFKLPNGQHASVVDSGSVEVKVGDSLLLSVDSNYRTDIKKNHSATHILNQSLRNVLGSHVEQKGSLVTTNRLRFDFNHYQNLTDDEILSIEKLVNEAIKTNYPVNTILTSIEEAKKAGAQALFGEKYGDVVRLVDMEYSKELCGGTHVSNTLEIGKLAVLSVESKGSGIFRIEAVSGNHIENEINLSISGLNDNIKLLTEKYEALKEAAKNEGFDIDFSVLPTYELTYSYQDIINKRRELEEVGNILKECEKRYDAMHREKSSSNYSDFMNNSVVAQGVTFLVQKVENMEVNVLKDVVDKITAPLDKCVVFFADVMDGKIVFIAKQKATSFNCGSLVKEAAIITGGNGGGRPDFAQAGGKDASKVDEALSTIKTTLGL